MGIKGTVRRTTDGHLIHANIDTDIIISEEPSTGSTKKPEELYRVIERFAQGTLHLSLAHCKLVLAQPCTEQDLGDVKHHRPVFVFSIASSVCSTQAQIQAHDNL